MRTALTLAACLVIHGAQAVQQTRPPVIRSRVDLVTTNVTVRDQLGQFVSTLGKDDFEVFAARVRQEPVMFLLTHGGRFFNEIGPPAAAAQEGLLLPAAR